MRGILLNATLLSLVACASQPQTDRAPAASRPPAPPPISEQAHATSIRKTPGGVTIPPRYRLVLKDGQPMYCRQELIIGSNIPKTVCVDEDGLRELEWRGQDARDDMTKAEKSCAGGMCGESR